MIDYLALVKDFQNKYGHRIKSSPALPSVNSRILELRYRLIEEEMREVLGVLENVMNRSRSELDLKTTSELLIRLADGIADCMYVLLGTALAFGIPIEAVFEEVHRSNMSKSTEVNEYGKTIRGSEYSPPDIAKIINDSIEKDNGGL